MMDILDRDFPVDPSDLLPDETQDTAVFWDGLKAGRLQAQSCDDCGRFRFPVAPVCPHCGSIKWQWRALSEHGLVFSWVRYRRGYLPEFADLMPYVVACVEFPEGVRMFGRLANAPKDGPVRIGASVRAEAERWPGGRCVVRFRLED